MSGGERSHCAVTPAVIAAWERRRYDRMRRQSAAGLLDALLPLKMVEEPERARDAIGVAAALGLLSLPMS